MEQPQVFVDSTKPNHVCLLKKSLYRLKQVSCAWFDRLSQFLLHIGFHCSKVDPSLFTFYTLTITVILLIYVDDILVASNSSSFIQNLLTQLGIEFAIKDLWLVHYFLSVEIKFTTDGVFLNQQKHTHDL